MLLCHFGFLFSPSLSQLHHTLGRMEASLLHHANMKIMSDFQKQEDRWEIFFCQLVIKKMLNITDYYPF